MADTDLQPEMTYTPGFVADPEALFTLVRDQVAWTDQMVSRRTASLGVPYNYNGASYPVNPWLPELQNLREQVAEAVGFMPSNCLLNNYPTGRSSLGWHQDDVTILAPNTGIAIVSLGAERPLRVRRFAEDGSYIYQSYTLGAGSLLYMTAAMQSIWQHSLRRAPTDQQRISLSFRQIVRWSEDGSIV
jgi:alkylated DNA repair dioxygenase AlkB